MGDEESVPARPLNSPLPPKWSRPTLLAVGTPNLQTPLVPVVRTASVSRPAVPVCTSLTCDLCLLEPFQHQSHPSKVSSHPPTIPPDTHRVPDVGTRTILYSLTPPSRRLHDWS